MKEARKKETRKKETAMGFFESTFKRVEEYQKVMEKVQSLQSQIFGNVEGVFPAEVKKDGTSGHIPFSKKYVGRNVKVLLLKENKKKMKKEEDHKE